MLLNTYALSPKVVYVGRPSTPKPHRHTTKRLSFGFDAELLKHVQRAEAIQLGNVKEAEIRQTRKTTSRDQAAPVQAANPVQDAISLEFPACPVRLARPPDVKRTSLRIPPRPPVKQSQGDDHAWTPSSPGIISVAEAVPYVQSRVITMDAATAKAVASGLQKLDQEVLNSNKLYTPTKSMHSAHSSTSTKCSALEYKVDADILPKKSTLPQVRLIRTPAQFKKMEVERCLSTRFQACLSSVISKQMSHGHLSGRMDVSSEEFCLASDKTSLVSELDSQKLFIERAIKWFLENTGWHCEFKLKWTQSFQLKYIDYALSD